MVGYSIIVGAHRLPHTFACRLDAISVMHKSCADCEPLININLTGILQHRELSAQIMAPETVVYLLMEMAQGLLHSGIVNRLGIGERVTVATIVGPCRNGFGFTQFPSRVYRCAERAVSEITAGRKRSAPEGHGGEKPRSGCRAAVKAIEMILCLLRISATRVVSFGSGEHLRSWPYKHREEFSEPQSVAFRARSSPTFYASYWPEHALVFQREIHRGVIARHDSLEHPLRLMILVNVYRSYIIGLHVASGQRIASLKHIEPFDIEILYALALISDRAVAAHVDTGQLTDHIFDRAVSI